jgi:hypothetical protein
MPKTRDNPGQSSLASLSLSLSLQFCLFGVRLEISVRLKIWIWGRRLDAFTLPIPPPPTPTRKCETTEFALQGRRKQGKLSSFLRFPFYSHKYIIWCLLLLLFHCLTHHTYLAQISRHTQLLPSILVFIICKFTY